ncbi:MAG TPA: FlgD immunoglobulin-like domain containing protein, partial [Candidatus Acidoferrum sp.]|nr:FlgD immunoglobulin-like domain containing protein [Candidatus Acidoferrum sp.]
AWFTWLDPRLNGLKVYASNYVYVPTDFNDTHPLLPAAFELEQNYPNPFNPTTEIRFSVVRQTRLTLAIYNLLGQKIRTLADGVYTSGEYRIAWDGTDAGGNRVASGAYFYRLSSDSFTQSRKMLLLK